MTVGKRAGHKPRGSKKRVRHGRQKRGERRKSVAEGKFAGRFVVMIGNKTVSPQIRFWRVHHSLPAPQKRSEHRCRVVSVSIFTRMQQLKARNRGASELHHDVRVIETIRRHSTAAGTSEAPRNVRKRTEQTTQTARRMTTYGKSVSSGVAPLDCPASTCCTS